MNEGHAFQAILAGQFPQREDFPTFPAQCKFWKVLEACWKLKPLGRPKMKDLLPKTFGENM
ncbi:hypothetical protein FRB98_004296 [Tulasnella sp. 332]|nr:hypothetical protein FRB98_004296 [Tulasnella sp. 332]